jgi:hypothetical protein
MVMALLREVLAFSALVLFGRMVLILSGLVMTAG